MAVPRRPRRPRTQAVTAARAGRLFRLLKLLSAKPSTRAVVLRRLKLDVRGFYRDLELLRGFGTLIELDEGRYVLRGTIDDALHRLPFPDPKLTLGEALKLARGKSDAHGVLKAKIEEITGSPATG